MALGNVTIVKSHQECVSMRQDGVTMASGGRRDASRWRQAGVGGVLG